ncbi:MAG: HlyD family efflux transporter periplasmic adaptor subunit, partial [Pirellula sp.]
GEMLVTLDSTELARELDRLHDEMRLERAKLESETVRIRHEHQSQNAQYLQLWGTLQKNVEDLSRLQRELGRIQTVKDSKVITAQELDRLVFMESGQRKLVEKLTAAVDELRNRSADGAFSEEPSATQQIKPTLARIEYLEGQIRRTQDRIREGELRSCVDGLVVRRHAAVGQVVSRMDSIMDVTVQDSVHIELFVRQDDVETFSIGKQLAVSVEPFNHAVMCTIVGHRGQYENAPNSIVRYYASQQMLMPIILKPDDKECSSLLSVGSIVKLKLLENLDSESPLDERRFHREPNTVQAAP